MCIYIYSSFKHIHNHIIIISNHQQLSIIIINIASFNLDISTSLNTLSNIKIGYTSLTKHNLRKWTPELESTRKIIENRFRVHKPSKSQKSTKSQQSTLLTIDLRHCARTWWKIGFYAFWTKNHLFSPKITYLNPIILINSYQAWLWIKSLIWTLKITYHNSNLRIYTHFNKNSFIT